jgi:membrane-bound lytic murein transglycosylase B
MARHRLPAHTRASAVVGRSFAALAVTMVGGFDLGVLRRQAIRATRAPALSIAAIAPLILASAVSGEGRRVVPLPATVAAASFTEVAVVSPAARNVSGPTVVAVAQEPVSLHIVAAATATPPPATSVNSTTTLGIPSMALAAYRNAEQKMAISNPGCGISWNLLAGIGRIESGHANGGATDARGTAVRPIYGPALDGTLPGNEIIVQGSAANGVTYARAIGPMQFLPGTWARYASDGDGDGVADPQNLYDSTLAAARYLCSGNLNLRDQSQTMAAVLRYNNSLPYARNVLGWAAAYATGVVPVDLPPTAGTAPPLGDMHLENPEGLGPGLPLNIHGLPPTDPLALKPLIDFDQPPTSDQKPVGPSQPPATEEPASCTLICIGQ